MKYGYFKDKEGKDIYIEDTHILHNGKKLADVIYPVGAIYISVNSTNPANLFGGQWEQIKDRFLLSSGDTYKNGSVGGSATHTIAVENLPAHNHTYLKANATTGSHTLTINEIPSHNHATTNSDANTDGFAAHKTATSGTINTILAKGSAGEVIRYMQPVSQGGGAGHTHSLNTTTTNTGSTGSGTALNTMPPYLTVYMWKRIS